MLGAFIVGMQAAGLALNFWQQGKMNKITHMGDELNQVGLENSIEQARLQSMQASVNSMKQLRQNLGSQIAMNAAMGRRSDAGSPTVGLQQSQGNWATDERVRRMNLLAKESSLRAGGVLNGLHQLKSETQMGQKLTQRIFNMIPGPSQAGAIGESLFNTFEGGDALSSDMFGG